MAWESNFSMADYSDAVFVDRNDGFMGEGNHYSYSSTFLGAFYFSLVPLMYTSLFLFVFRIGNRLYDRLRHRLPLVLLGDGLPRSFLLSVLLGPSPVVKLPLELGRTSHLC